MYFTEMKVNGMYCGHCIMKVTGALESIGGQDVQADIPTGRVTFRSKEKPSVSAIVEALGRIDYTANGVLIHKED